jgi:hypothetical protein
MVHFQEWCGYVVLSEWVPGQNSKKRTEHLVYPIHRHNMHLPLPSRVFSKAPAGPQPGASEAFHGDFGVSQIAVILIPLVCNQQRSRFWQHASHAAPPKLGFLPPTGSTAHPKT